MTSAGPENEESGESTDDRYGSGPRLSPALIATLVAIPVMVLVGFITFAAFKSDDENTDPAAKYATDPALAQVCQKLLAAVPDHFDGYQAKEVRGQNAVWAATGDTGDDISLRCGVSRPADLGPSSSLQVIRPANSDAAQWFLVDSIQSSGQAWVAVDHRPYILLWLPVKAGDAPLTDITATLTKVLEPAPLDFGPAPAGTSSPPTQPTR
ncbi:DUF3515 domain-containing protein [Gordonia sp. ABSL1-1]|uniref:DUF3515 domain-containing protein n=1 Tax=Gordonia sp. ABSL1-1 TaxID=3053923 RepID=UPI002572AACC|nr:DUF3515 domain-containing protein [Gordonia sp. ABSL1-1]MDL9935567.1 DUF3515 domain-containing protein [Gordonia sp. ABSL1-1]